MWHGYNGKEWKLWLLITNFHICSELEEGEHVSN